MKFFVTIAFVLAIAAVSNASVSKIAKPLLRTIVPLTNGLNNGLQCAAPQIENGIDDAGCALKNTVGGVGSVAQGALCGAGETLNKLPGAAYSLLKNLGHAGLVGNLLGSLLGSGRGHEHCDSSSD